MHTEFYNVSKKFKIHCFWKYGGKISGEVVKVVGRFCCVVLKHLQI